MTINKLTASFGKLENETLSFHDGLNVIHAPNESGKSTWCAFIRAMLYGVDSGERARGSFLPDKQRYAPWSGAPMEGQMDLTVDRCNITLTRTTRMKSAPMREFTATYTGTNVRVEGMTGTNAGEQLTGVTRDVFRRSAFIEQGSVAVSGSPDLERRINAIVSTGEEETSYTEADARLRAWLRKRRYNRRGMLPDIESRIEESRRLLEDMDGSAENIDALEQRLEKTKADCARLEDAVTESRKLQRRESLETLNRGRTALAEASAEHDAAMERLSECRSELRQGAFGGADLGAVEEKAGKDLTRMAELKAVYKKKISPLPLLLMFLLTAVGVTLYTVYDALVWIIAAGVFLVGAVVFLTLYLKARRAADEAREQRGKILRSYGVSHASELSAALEDYRKRFSAVASAEDNERRTRENYEQARRRQEKLEETALADLDFVAGSSPAARLGRELNSRRAEAERLSAQIATLKGRLSAMGDTMVLRSELGTMETERAQLEQEYEDISLAAETLRSADEELQSRFSPELGRVAAEYMSRVTGGRYSQVLINRDFSAMTRTDADAVAHDSSYLSAGTMDLLYLAVRLAVCRLALPEGEPCPLIIDDALVNLDETRLKQAMELLSEIAKERQVILFTCRKAD
ncbi:MAG: AAA family ATPase [Oscillospiraceae bacterium]|nr:AAA family ATPase [Oscillospiraceae bacterium]